jgi:GAF domain-containing protein
MIEAAFLDEATQLFNSTLDLMTVLQKVAQLATQVLGDSCTIFLLEEGTDVLLPAATYTVDPAQAQLRNATLWQDPLRIGGPSITGQAAATGQPILVSDATTDPRVSQAHREVLALRSCLAAPIISKGRIFGVLGSSITTPGRQLTEQDLRLAMATADRAALAIENARLFTLEQRRRQQLQAILEINQEITKELNLESLLPLIIQKATALLEADGGCLYRYEEATELLLPQAWHNLPPQIPISSLQLTLGEGVTGRAASQRQGLLVNDYQTSPHGMPLFVVQGVTAAVAQPLIGAGKLLGVVTVGRWLRTSPFTAQDQALLETLAHQAAIALDNAELYERERRARSVAEARAQQLAILIAISAALSSSLKLEDILQRVGPEVLRYTHFEQLAIMLLDEDGQHWRRAFMLFPKSDYQVWTREPVAGTRTGWVITHQQPMVVHDLARETAPHFVLDQRLLHNGVRSSIYMPLVCGDQVLGTLNVHSRSPGVSTPEHVDLLQEIGHRLATAIYQARLFEALEQAYRQRQDAAEEVRRLNKELEQRVRQRTGELEAANKELEAFSYTVSHDLRAPLRAIDGFSRILLEEHAPYLSDEARRYLHIVRDSAQEMGQLIDDLLSFSRLGRQPLTKQLVAPAHLVRQALEDLRSEREGRCVNLVIGELPACQADPVLLKQVFVNLLANALKFTRRREVASIEIGCREAGGEVVYFVKDNGVGFEMQYAAKLFGVFQRLHRVEDYEGTGVGLAIVQRIIHRHGGRVWAEAAVDQGATFAFTLGGAPPNA